MVHFLPLLLPALASPCSRLSPLSCMSHGVPISPPHCPLRRGPSGRRSRRPLLPPVALLPRFLECPMATLSAGCAPIHPPPSPRPMWRCSPRSIPLTCPPPPLRLSPPPLGPCGRSILPTRSFPQPRLPISPVGTKMLAIERTGLSRVVRWRAGPCPVGNVPGVLAPESGTA